MHRGCFVWTPTPPLSGRRTPRPGPARVCVCVLCLAGSGRLASRARSGTPHLFLWPLRSSSLFGPLRAWVALFAVVFFFVCAPPLCPAFRVFGPGVPWALASCSPPPFIFSFFLFLPPPAFLFFAPPSCFVRGIFLFFFSAALFVVVCFSRCPFCCFFFLPVVRWGVGLCVCVCGVCWCVVLLALRSVVRCVLCLVLCGVLVPGWVLAPGCPAQCCAWLCWAVFVVPCCRVLLCSPLVVFFALFRAFPWWSVLFWSVWCSAVVCLAVWRRNNVEDRQEEDRSDDHQAEDHLADSKVKTPRLDFRDLTSPRARGGRSCTSRGRSRGGKGGQAER